MASYSVRESENNLTVCIAIDVGPHTKERNVLLTVFSDDGKIMIFPGMLQFLSLSVNAARPYRLRFRV